MNNQFDNSLDLAIPHPKEEFYISPEIKSSGITLLMKTVLLYKTHPHLFHSIIKSVCIADINAKNNKGWTALMIACEHCNTNSSVECVKLLLEHGADINVKENNDGWTALIIACLVYSADSSIECVKLLLEHGADINANDNDGCTAFMFACLYCNTDSNIECVKLLIEHGADINVKNKDGSSAVMVACRYCNTDSNIECVKLLIQHGADINVKNNKGYTCLMVAFDYCNTNSSIECVKLLLVKGAQLNLEDNSIIVNVLNELFRIRIEFIDDMLQNHHYMPEHIVDQLERCFQLYYYKTGYSVLNERIQNISSFKQCMKEGINCTDIITAQYL